MSYEEPNFDNPEEGALPEESNNNRTFLIAAGILGGIILLSIACLVGVYIFTQNAATSVDAQATTIAITSTANENFISNSLTSTAAAVIQPSATLAPTNTLVVNVPTVTLTPDPNATTSAPGAAGTSVAATATVGAALTQAAIAQLTIVPTTTALPNTGFMDEVGIPGLVVMSLVFIIVILLARRLRFAPGR